MTAELQARAKTIRAHYRANANLNLSGGNLPDIETLIKARVAATSEINLLATGDALAEERRWVEARLAELKELAEGKDSAGLMRGVFGQLLSANLTALRAVSDHIELRRATLVSGTASPLIAAALGDAKS
ncbi:hypothetical protein [Paracoccus sp. PAR01]|uniref:hypothetical protein n=1 Tax=Paracoccus sp. PAR01 TaxID=2769282 RepID=UPI00177DA13C|nr:hypothetical protein [Paracoccus sp. PAR01]MBD9527833.1 hypothetical protein [Paracoccus sp. PAR01]